MNENENQLKCTRFLEKKNEFIQFLKAIAKKYKTTKIYLYKHYNIF